MLGRAGVGLLRRARCSRLLRGSAPTAPALWLSSPFSSSFFSSAAASASRSGGWTASSRLPAGAATGGLLYPLSSLRQGGYWPGGSFRHLSIPIQFKRSKKNPSDAELQRSLVKKPERKVNKKISAKVLRIVFDDDRGHKIMSRTEALRLAEEAKLDLVDPNADPPVVKLMKWAKVRFEQKLKNEDVKKKQMDKRRADVLKEVHLTARTAMNDLRRQAKLAAKFLQEGMKVKVVITFKKDDDKKNKGGNHLDLVMQQVQHLARIDIAPQRVGARQFVTLSPLPLRRESLSSPESSGAEDEAIARSDPIREADGRHLAKAGDSSILELRQTPRMHVSAS
eukprot:jgi/Chlat1/9030/Chrsp94S08352